MEEKRLNKEKRREQIKEAALKLFIEKGYSKTSMDEIIRAVGLSKGGMYHHFSNKEEIFMELLRDGSEYRKNTVLEYMREHPGSRREKLIDSLLDKILDENPYKRLYTVFLIEMQSNAAFQKLFEEIYDTGLKDFVDFCKKEGFEEYIAISNREFTFLINSLYIGIHSFENIDKVKLKDMLRIMFQAYLKS